MLSLLAEKKELLEFIASRLLEIETMEGKEFYEIVNNAKRCEKIQIEAKNESPDSESESESEVEKSPEHDVSVESAGFGGNPNSVEGMV